MSRMTNVKFGRSGQPRFRGAHYIWDTLTGISQSIEKCDKVVTGSFLEVESSQCIGAASLAD